jgi:hypothetical protein
VVVLKPPRAWQQPVSEKYHKIKRSPPKTAQFILCRRLCDYPFYILEQKRGGEWILHASLLASSGSHTPLRISKGGLYMIVCSFGCYFLQVTPPHPLPSGRDSKVQTRENQQKLAQTWLRQVLLANQGCVQT